MIALNPWQEELLQRPEEWGATNVPAEDYEEFHNLDGDREESERRSEEPGEYEHE